MTFKLNPGQERAQKDVLEAGKRFCLLYGGSRSGKTALFCSAIMDRALAAPTSRHLIIRKEGTSAKRAVVKDTFPKVWGLKYPTAPKPVWHDKDGVFDIAGGAQVWVGGVNDDKAMERILGNEYSTVLINEASEVSYSAFLLLRSRLAQVAPYGQGLSGNMSQRLYADLNPTTRMHWTYRLWVEGIDPVDEVGVDRDDYAHAVINPFDNIDNLSGDYLADLGNLPERQKRRFLLGEYSSDDEDALWRRSYIHRSILKEDGNWPVKMRRIVISIDPAVSNKPGSDETGIVAVGLGFDGRGYVLADDSGRFRPEEWARRAVSMFHSLGADRIIGEVNNGGDLIESVLRAQAPNVPYKAVRATRGKAMRAEPVAALYERGKIFHIGKFTALEDQMCFPAGTPVLTKRGDVPIEAITSEDYVLTRKGFAPVKVACHTGNASKFMVIRTTDGRRITCTPNHPIFIASRGFVPAAHVKAGDSLQDAPDLGNTVGPLTGGDAGITECLRGITGMQKASCFIETFGKRTWGQFLMGCTFITRTATQAITRLKTLNVLPLASTTPNTSLAGGMVLDNMDLPLLKSANQSGLTGSSENIGAFSAEIHLKAVAHGSRSIAAMYAGSGSARPSAQRIGHVPTAAKDSGQQTQGKFIAVKSVAKKQTQSVDVYNLEVEAGFLPEYFANGILVHNCAVTVDFDDKTQGWSPDRVDALVWGFTYLFPGLAARNQSVGPAPAPQFSMV